MPPALLPIIAIGTAVAGTAASIYSSDKAAGEQKKANRATQQRDALQAARQRRDAVRAARQAYANAQQSGVNQGVAGSSGSEGGLASIVSQFNSNMSFLGQYGVLTDQASAHLGRATTHANRANFFGGVADIGMSVFNNSDRISQVFSPNE